MTQKKIKNNKTKKNDREKEQSVFGGEPKWKLVECDECHGSEYC